MNSSSVTIIYILLLVFPVCVAFMCISVVLGAAPSSHQTHPALLMQLIISSPSHGSGLIHFCLHGAMGCLGGASTPSSASERLYGGF